MGRGVSSGGGQSSLGYLFGSDEKPAGSPPTEASAQQHQDPASQHQDPATVSRTKGAGRNRDMAAGSEKLAISQHQDPAGLDSAAAVSVSRTEDAGSNPDMAAGKHERNPNDYHRADGQNTGNFITDRPSTKVHSAPGGGADCELLDQHARALRRTAS